MRRNQRKEIKKIEEKTTKNITNGMKKLSNDEETLKYNC